MKQKKRIRIGILGCSDIARRRFLPALLKASNAELALVASREAGKAKQFCPSAEYGTASYEGLLASKKVDLVYISLPNHLHEMWTMKALAHGKHVICEKPLGLTYESVDRMAAYAQKRGLLLYENMMYLHHPQHQKVRELIAAGIIGKVRSLRAAFGFCLGRGAGFRLKAAEGGGSFHDQARYPLSAALFFLESTPCRFSGYSYDRGDLNVGMSACATTSANESFWFSIGFEQQYECWYEIVGEKGKLRVDRAFTTPADCTNFIDVITGQESTSLLVAAADHFMLMIEHVCGLLQRRNSYCGSYSEARRLALLAEQAWVSCDRVSIR